MPPTPARAEGPTVAAFYWCLAHERVEEGARCRAAERLGPYSSAEAARSWNERVAERQEAWDAEDERWEGDDDDGDGDG